MKELSKKDIFDLFEQSKVNKYKKKGLFLYRPAIPNETVLTIVDGKLETLKTCNINQVSAPEVILRNIEIGSSAETYIVDKDKFDDRYERIFKRSDVLDYVTIDGVKWYKAKGKGEVFAFEYKGESIKFMAPWDEPVPCYDGDFIARPVGGDVNDIYRIERETFHQTYGETISGNSKPIGK